MKCPSCSTENRTSAKSGEAGLGKSRLMAEWRKAVRMEGDEPPVRWVEGRCLSYGGSVAYHLGIDILRSLVGDIAGARESFQPMWRPGGDPVHALQGFTVAGPGIAAWSAADGQLEHGLSFCDWILGYEEPGGPCRIGVPTPVPWLADNSARRACQCLSCAVLTSFSNRTFLRPAT